VAPVPGSQSPSRPLARRPSRSAWALSGASCPCSRHAPAPSLAITPRRYAQRLRLLYSRRPPAADRRFDTPQGIDATLAEWQEILEIAFRFAANCAGAYKSAGDRSRKLFNHAVFEQLLVQDGVITEVRYNAPFGHIFGVEEFEQRSMVDLTGSCSNLLATRETLEGLARAAGWLGGV
jgi:hypothetical protein